MRKFVSLFLVTSFLVLMFSSVVLYIMPHGRVAYWIDWRFLGLNKDSWQDLHITFGILFCVLVLWHVWLNLRVLKKYLTSKYALIAGLLTIFILVLCVLNLPPVSYVGQLEEKVKATWKPAIPPPTFHAELLSLKKFVKLSGLSLAQAKACLQAQGIKFKSFEEKVKLVCKKNHKSPMELYNILLSCKMK